MPFFNKNTPPEPAAAKPQGFKEFDSRALASLIKLGGKKKLDVLLELFKAEAPNRVNEIEKAHSAAEAIASAKVLKASAASLGLNGLEDVCDQIIAAGASFSPASALGKSVRPFLTRALAYLGRERKTF